MLSSWQFIDWAGRAILPNRHTNGGNSLTTGNNVTPHMALRPFFPITHYKLMKYKIDAETQKLTSCHNDFHCLLGDMEGVCKFFESGGSPIVVTGCPQRTRECHYCKPFDTKEGFCKCPTRIELYIRYGI